MKALVVDDEKLIVKGLKFSLEQEGYEVDCAYDGQEAVDKAKETEYDIVLLDLMLPILTGYEVCQQIREFSDMPIIMQRVMIWTKYWALNMEQMIILQSLLIYWK